VEKLSDPKVMAGMARRGATEAATTAVASAQERATTAKATAQERASTAVGSASSTIDRYRTQARDRFFERRRRGNIRPVPDEPHAQA